MDRDREGKWFVGGKGLDEVTSNVFWQKSYRYFFNKVTNNSSITKKL